MTLSAKNQHIKDLPVSKVEYHEDSELHEYNFFADFLVKYSDQLENPIAKDPLDSLERLMSALKDIDGGILGQNACDRGMDLHTIRSLAAFSREFAGSENAQARGIAQAFISMHLAHYQEKETGAVNAHGDISIETSSLER